MATENFTTKPSAPIMIPELSRLSWLATSALRMLLCRGIAYRGSEWVCVGSWVKGRGSSKCCGAGLSKSLGVF
ncbi:hypothetical protein CMUS01_04879 [Colletotrichum musicola]|uniref:Uncharacterized protein n=1 Tax=Colletotrichum musicola TaxID=2175873 RepID=A0A8H6NLJ1_9PEZI|nr:hypothetical protein CMUS01_04879 [Colletotrichum musicola]